MNILVIDDEPVVRTIIIRMLRHEDHTFYSAGNGKEGMSILKEHPDVDLVITDLIMPEQEGIETIQFIKVKYPEIKIIAISGGGRGSAENYLTIAKGLGAQATLTKPFIKAELLEVVHQVTGG